MLYGVLVKAGVHRNAGCASGPACGLTSKHRRLRPSGITLMTARHGVVIVGWATIAFAPPTRLCVHHGFGDKPHWLLPLASSPQRINGADNDGFASPKQCWATATGNLSGSLCRGKLYVTCRPPRMLTSSKTRPSETAASANDIVDD